MAKAGVSICDSGTFLYNSTDPELINTAVTFSLISKPGDFPADLEHWILFQRPSLGNYCKPIKMDQCFRWSLGPTEISWKISLDFSKVKFSSSAFIFHSLRRKLFLKPPCHALCLFIKQRCQSVPLYSFQTCSHWVIFPGKGLLNQDTQVSGFISKGEPVIKRSAPSGFWKPSVLQSRTYPSMTGGSTAFNFPECFIALLYGMTLF